MATWCWGLETWCWGQTTGWQGSTTGSWLRRMWPVRKWIIMYCTLAGGESRWIGSLKSNIDLNLPSRTWTPWTKTSSEIWKGSKTSTAATYAIASCADSVLNSFYCSHLYIYFYRFLSIWSICVCVFIQYILCFIMPSFKPFRSTLFLFDPIRDLSPGCRIW